MSVSYVQTDTSATFNVGCSGQTAGATTAGRQATVGGTAGVTAVTVDPGNAVTRAAFAFDCGAPGSTAIWAAGTWTIPINHTTMDAGTQLTRVDVCDYNGSTFTVVASNTSPGHTLGATGVVTVSVTQSSAHTPQNASTSRPFIVLTYTNGDSHGSSSLGITPNQTISAPIVIPVIATPTQGTLAAAGQTPTVIVNNVIAVPVGVSEFLYTQQTTDTNSVYLVSSSNDDIAGEQFDSLPRGITISGVEFELSSGAISGVVDAAIYSGSPPSGTTPVATSNNSFSTNLGSKAWFRFNFDGYKIPSTGPYHVGVRHSSTGSVNLYLNSTDVYAGGASRVHISGSTWSALGSGDVAFKLYVKGGISGYAPSLLLSSDISVASGIASFAGQAPSAAVGLSSPTMQPNAGSLVLSGAAPTAYLTEVASPSAGALSFAGSAPWTIVPHVVVPDKRIILQQLPPLTEAFIYGTDSEGIAFTLSKSESVIGISTRLSKGGNPPGNFYVRFYNVGTGTVGVNAAPVGSPGTPLAEKIFPCSLIETGAPKWYDLIFASAVSLSPGDYVIVVAYDIGDGSNYINVSYGTTNTPTYNRVVFYGGTWTGNTAQSLQFSMLSDVLAQPTVAGQASTVSVQQSSETFTPAQAALALAGLAPAANVSCILSPAEDALAVVGQAPMAEQSYGQAPAQYNLTLATFAPTTREDRNALPAQAALAIAGQTPDAVSREVVAPVAAALAFATLAPAAFVSRAFDVGAAALAFSSFAPDAGVSYTLSPSAAALSTVGEAPSTGGAIGMAPLAAALAIVGETPSSSQAVFAGVGAGSLSATGLPPGLGSSYAASPGCGTVSAVGEAPVAQSGDFRTAQPATGALAIAGEAPVAQSGDSQTAQPSTGSLTVAGSAPAAELSYVFAIAAGTVAAAGAAPVGREEILAQPGSASVLVAGAAPAPGQSYVRAPAARSVAVSGKAPSAERSYAIAVASGAASTLGDAPALVYEYRFTPAEGVVALAGRAPVRGGDYFFDLVEARLTVVGYELIQSADAHPGLLDLSIAGQPITLGRTYLKAVGPARMSLSKRGAAFSLSKRSAAVGFAKRDGTTGFM